MVIEGLGDCGYLRTCVEETAEQFAVDCDLACTFHAYKLLGDSEGLFPDMRLVQGSTELGLDITLSLAELFPI